MNKAEKKIVIKYKGNESTEYSESMKQSTAERYNTIFSTGVDSGNGETLSQFDMLSGRFF